MKVGSLFAGIGGFDLAAERAGMDVAWQSELDPHASKVLAHHWPDVPNLGDIHEIGCSCHLQAGVRRESHNLDSPGIDNKWRITSRHQDSLRTIIGSLVDLGYGVVWRVLDARWFGVAQRRRRVFIVGHSGGQPRPEILALAQSVCGDSPPSRETGGRTAPTLAARTRSGSGPELISFNWQTGGNGMLSPRSTHTDALHVGQTPAVAFAQPNHSVRRLTPLEAERLQGFPDHWTATPGNSDSQRYKQLGNAVAVPVAEWILGNITKAAA